MGERGDDEARSRGSHRLFARALRFYQVANGCERLAQGASLEDKARRLILRYATGARIVRGCLI